jgi:hypothetical protein
VVANCVHVQVIDLQLNSNMVDKGLLSIQPDEDPPMASSLSPSMTEAAPVVGLVSGLPEQNQ